MKMKRSLILAVCAVLQTLALGVPVFTSEAPVNSLELTVGAINKAKSQILLNVYELSSPEVQQALLKQVTKGIEVQILLEGEPFANSPEQRDQVAKSIDATSKLFSKAMRSKGANSKSRFFVMTVKAGGKRRYRWNHAKYIIVDQSAVLVGSENYSPTGQPAPGTIGNRGWETFIVDAKTASYFNGLFEEDISLKFNDVIEFSRRTTPTNDVFQLNERILPEFDFEGLLTFGRAKGDLKISQVPRFDADSVKSFSSPVESEPGLLDLIDSARESLDIQQMSFPIHWNNAIARNPLFEAVLKAARNHVRVRVLLNDTSVFGSPDDNTPNPSTGDLPGNVGTVKLLNKIAKAEKLKLEARIVNVSKAGITYIHNKGVLADGTKTLISSINWTGNAVRNNRETAALINGSEIFNHYEVDFNRDWIASKGKQK